MVKSFIPKVMSYKQYLNSNHWKDKKTEIYVRQGCRRCGICGSSKKLNIHHTSYKNLGKEKEKDLLVLCEGCHNKYHNGLVPEEVLNFINNNRRFFHQPVKKSNLTRKQRLKRWKERKQ